MSALCFQKGFAHRGDIEDVAHGYTVQHEQHNSACNSAAVVPMHAQTGAPRMQECWLQSPRPKKGPRLLKPRHHIPPLHGFHFLSVSLHSTIVMSISRSIPVNPKPLNPKPIGGPDCQAAQRLVHLRDVGPSSRWKRP